MRLVNGPNSTSGRVEICYNNSWGTVCDDLWGDIDAEVVCHQLGFSRLGTLPNKNYGDEYGQYYITIGGILSM